MATDLGNVAAAARLGRISALSKRGRALRPGLSPGIGLALLLLAGGPARVAEPSAADAEFFEKEVRPLLAEKCWGCHGEDRAKGDSG